MIAVKLAVVTAAVSTGLVASLAEVSTGLSLTGHPAIDGILGGGTAALATAIAYKYKVDRLENDIKTKADRDEINPRLERIERAVERVETHLLSRSP